MSGPFGSSQWMYSSGGFYPYGIDQSLRFNDDDSAYLNKTFASDGNRRTFTLSMWFKLGNIPDSDDFIYYSGTGGSATQSWIYFNSSNSFRLIFGIRVSSTNYQITLDPIYRDPSAWYHLVWSVDTTQATAADRVKIYVNGEQPSINSSSYPPINSDTSNGAAGSHALAATTAGASFFDGYLSEVNFIDGTALDASSFGETKSGIWVAKAYSGSYGTNGFHLKFDGNVNDSSGNGNNWTANNLSSHDYVPDSPTNNFSTLNVLNKYSSVTLTEGNLTAKGPDSAWRNVDNTIYMSSGKWYWEVYINNVSTYQIHGIIPAVRANGRTDFPFDYYPGTYSNEWGYDSRGYLHNSASPDTSWGSSYTTGDVLGFELDMDAGTLDITKNGVSTGSQITGISGTYRVCCAPYGSTSTATYNFGQDSTFAGATTAGGNSDANGIGDFKYAPPSGGYLSLCASNLPAPAIDPAADDTPEDYFNTVTWTGDGSTGGNAITGVGFQPEFVWLKQRNGTAGHLVHDIVRGTQTGGYIPLAPSATNAESDYGPAFLTAYGAITSLDSDGFTVVDGNLTTDNYNGSSDTYVAWNWKAGGTAVSNTAGSITSQVSANTEAGFSIVSYTATNTTGTVGHGLGSVPKMIIVRDREDVAGWIVYHEAIGNTKRLLLNSTGADVTDSTAWNNTTPTSSVFSVGTNTNYLTHDHIAYCFAEVEGYSKLGSYTGNGSTDGSFVYTGFRPALVLVKRIATGSWGIFDNTRSPDNAVNEGLYPNLNNAESTATDEMDFLSNGFKLRSTGSVSNDSGVNTVYLAIAEQPFKYSNAR